MRGRLLEMKKKRPVISVTSGFGYFASYST